MAQKNDLTRFINNDEVINPENQEAAEDWVHYCDENPCEELPETQVLKIRVIINCLDLDLNVQKTRQKSD